MYITMDHTDAFSIGNRYQPTYRSIPDIHYCFVLMLLIIEN